MVERTEVSIDDNSKSNCYRIKRIWGKFLGCICSKRIRAFALRRKGVPTKRTSSRKREEALDDVDGDGNETSIGLISNQLGDDNVGRKSELGDEGENRKKSPKVADVKSALRIERTPNGDKGGQIVAGWPSWLTSVAGEAINGWVPRPADSYEKLHKIGQGTYSSVYKALDLETGKIVALKKVRFANMDPESVRFMAREIIILRKLDHPNVMKLEAIITSKNSNGLYLVFEYMEHDLTGLLSSHGAKFTEAQIKCYMRQLLLGLEHCHSRGVLHRDIKGSNLLIDSDGNLKIGDFGLAAFFSHPQKHQLTSRVVTLWYRPPELLLGTTDYGVGVDLWSSGCILAELFHGKPIMPGRTEVEQLHKVFKLCGSPSEDYWKRSKLPHTTVFKPQHQYKRCIAETFKNFPSSALKLLDVLLAIEPEDRGTASSALTSELFTTAPLPCDPSSLPKYPASKELDIKLRDAKKRKKDQSSSKKSSKESKVRPVPDANEELQTKQRSKYMAASVHNNYKPVEDDSRNMYPHSVHPAHRGAEELSRFSKSIAYRSGSDNDLTGSAAVNTHWRNGRFNDSEDPHQLLGWSNLLRVEKLSGFESGAKNQLHQSGPLVPPGGNIDDMLKEHERKIQEAVRKARGKNKGNNSKKHGRTEEPLCYGITER